MPREAPPAPPAEPGALGAPPGVGRARRDRRRAARTTAAVAVVLHTLAVLWLWLRWETGLRGTWLVWTDFPVSLLYLELRGAWLLVGSLVAGGAWWAAIGAAVSLFVGFVVGRR